MHSLAARAVHEQGLRQACVEPVTGTMGRKPADALDHGLSIFLLVSTYHMNGQ